MIGYLVALDGVASGADVEHQSAKSGSRDENTITVALRRIAVGEMFRKCCQNRAVASIALSFPFRGPIPVKLLDSGTCLFHIIGGCLTLPSIIIWTHAESRETKLQDGFSNIRVGINGFIDGLKSTWKRERRL